MRIARWIAVLGLAGVMAAQAPHALTDADKARIDAIVNKMTIEEKIDYIGGTGFAVRALPRLNLPALEMSDGPIGVRSNKGLPSTTYAAGIALASTWDRSLAQDVGGGIGRDARARGVMYMLGPGVNIYRSPRNGRNFEYMGEDPYLGGQMAANYILGMQAHGVSATVKHFLANNSEFLRHDSDSVVGERALREIYLPAFEAAVRQGHVGAVMDSYNLINGTHATQNGVFNTQILRNDWGFQGTLMSDWSASYDGVAEANGGLDLEMPRAAFMNAKALLPAIKAGTVTEATIDEKVKHILGTAVMFGWLDREQKDSSIALDDPADNAVALRAARESVTLLKNAGAVLPLDASRVKSVLVLGANADPGAPVGGGSAGVKPVHTTSLLEGLKMAAPGVKVTYEVGIKNLSELADSTNFMTDASGGKPGVVVEQFASHDLTGDAQKSVIEHIDVDHVDAPAGPKREGRTSRRYTGYFSVENDEAYDIAAAGGFEGNGWRLFVDGKLLVDNWDIKRAAAPWVKAMLTRGMHKVVVETWQGGGRGAGMMRMGICREKDVVSPRVRELAKSADAVIVAAGFQGTPKVDEDEGEGADRSFTLPYGQEELILAAAEANPRTIVAVTSGGNVDSQSWVQKVPVWIEQWYGGQSEGQALAEAIFGNIDPSGHLPATFERVAEDNPTFKNYYPAEGTKQVFYKEGIFVGYRGYEKNGVAPLFPFGFGLSYTTFSFRGLKVAAGPGAGATVTFDVTNTGKRAGTEVAQVYVGEDAPKVERPKHELKGFERVELAPGETKHVSVMLNARAFAYWSEATHGWTIDPGAFTVSVGDSVASLPLTAKVTMQAASIGEAKF